MTSHIPHVIDNATILKNTWTVFTAHMFYIPLKVRKLGTLACLRTGDVAGLASWWRGSQPHLRQPCVYAGHSLEPSSRGPGCGSVPSRGTDERRLHSSVSFILHITKSA